MRKLTLSIFALCLVLVSCDVTSLNQNEKEPTDVPADPLFTNAQVTLGNFIHETDVNDGIYKLMAQWWTTTTYTDETRYNLTGREIAGNVWTRFYRDILVDLKEAKTKVEANELLSEGVRNNKLASIEVLTVLTYSMLVNTFGDIPYSEALNFENTQPAYDDDQAVFMDLMSRLDTAIGMFDPSAAGFGGADVYYNGNIENWIKFANSLKMRMAITIADVNPEAAEAAIVEAAPNAISSNEENAMIPFTASPPHTSPVWEALVQSGRDDYIPAAPLVDRMNNLNDPRRPVFFTQVGGEYIGGEYGDSNDYTLYSHFSETIEAPDRPGMILGYAEVEFILAEAAARGFNVSGTAASHYNAAITADMEYWGVPDSEITDYLTQASVVYDPLGDFRQQIGTQKWIALFMQGLQGWTEFRRLGAPDLEAPEFAANGIEEVPSRFTYPIDEQNFNNASYSEAASAMGGDLLTTKIFWDVVD
jgi:hypothetical protein